MTTFERMKQVLRDSGHFTEEQIQNLFSSALTGSLIASSNEDDDETDYESDDESVNRTASIEKIINLYDSIEQTDDMDWDDKIGKFSYKLPEHIELKGITLREYLSLENGFNSPRMTLNVIEDLRLELKGILTICTLKIIETMFKPTGKFTGRFFCFYNVITYL